VLVPAYRPDGRFTDLLRSMAAQTHPHITVRVSLDPSPGATLPEIPPMGLTELEIVEQPRRLGWLPNVNWLFGSVSTPYFLQIGHDDRLTPGYIADAVRVLEDRPGVVAAHGGIRYHGIRDGEMDPGRSIGGGRLERLLCALDRGLHLAGLLQRGVIRSEPLRHGAIFRRRRSDGQFANDLWALELLAYGESVAIEGVWYDKYTDPGGLSRVFHARTVDQKSAMLADNLACLVQMVRDRGFSEEEQELVATRYAEWLLGLQGNWNVLADQPSSDASPYRAVRPGISRFVARSLLSAATRDQERS
jgi:hypothetical protein